MTNHPRRQRDDENQPPENIEELAAAAAGESPVVQELAAKLGPPAHTPNGTGEAYKPDAAKLIGHAVGEKVADVILQALPQALAQVLSQVPVRAVLPQWFKCSTCVAGRVAWMSRHATDLEQAVAVMTQVTSQWPADDPRRDQVNALMFLPAELQPSPDPARPNPQACPPVSTGDVMMNGAVYCGDHVPGLQQAGGRKEFLIANAPLTPAMIAEIMGQGQQAA